MDVKQYYRKIREIEASLSDKFPLVVSLETSDGGKPGMISEVPRPVAAKLLVEGRAVLATEEEKELYRRRQLAEQKAAEQAQIARTVRVAILSDHDFQARPGRKSPGESGTGK